MGQTGKATPMGIVGDWFSFQGRASRKTYWLHYVVVSMALNVGLDLVVWPLSHFAGGRGDAGAAGLSSPGLQVLPSVVFCIGALVLFIGGFAGGAKRCHDRDRSGWFQLIVLIPFIGPLWLLVELGFLRGTQGMNRFGADPLAFRRY
jgi:uncharacterized membrane protein YhaH (DUF805 family)